MRESITDDWSTVCDDGWNKQHADMICNMVGYKGAQKHLRRGWIGKGNILVSNPICNSYDVTTPFENSLFDCEYQKKNQCTHSEDVGLVCVRDKLVI